jgi:chemotaxis response regulator CheB
MATLGDVKREREAPVVAVLELTEAELERVFNAAVFDEVAAERASQQALSDVGTAATYTLAEKVRKLHRVRPEKTEPTP